MKRYLRNAVAGCVVEIFDDVVVGVRTPREKAREFVQVLEFFEVIAAMCAGRPGQNGNANGSRPASAAAETSVPASRRRIRGTRHAGIPASTSTTASRVVRRILPGR